MDYHITCITFINVFILITLNPDIISNNCGVFNIPLLGRVKLFSHIVISIVN